MSDIKVHTDIGGLICVVQFGQGWEHYINVCRDVRYPEASFIEVVRAGCVRSYEVAANVLAPERIIELMKEQLRA